MNPGPTASQKVVRHFIACARVLISATRSLNPTQIETEMWYQIRMTCLLVNSK